MNRLQKLSLMSVATTLVLVAIGAFTRGSGSGFGCADRWPLCEGGVLGGILPRWEFHMVVEWTHRWVAAVVIGLLVWLAVTAWRRHREQGGLRWPAVAAVVIVLAQAGLGAAVVKAELHADLVATHLFVAMVTLGILAYVAVNSFFLARMPSQGPAPRSETPDRGWRRLLAVGAGAVLAVIVLGSTVHDQYVGGWPLVGGRLVPEFASRVVELHFAHRLVAALALVVLVVLAAGAVRRGRPRTETLLVHGAAFLYVVNVGLGAAHVFTRVTSTALVVAHLALAALAWTSLVAAATLARRHDEHAALAEERPVAPAQAAAS